MEPLPTTPLAPSLHVHLRPFQVADTLALVKLYRDTVRQIGPDFYTASQVEAWAVYPEDVDDFSERLARGYTLVAEVNGTALAFGQIDPVDFVSFIYTSAAVSRRGVATRLCDELETYAFSRGVTSVRTEASRIARAFFLKRGYKVDSILKLIHFGVQFEWYCMSKKRPAVAADAIGAS